jgi:hypothetical protein
MNETARSSREVAEVSEAVIAGLTAPVLELLELLELDDAAPDDDERVVVVESDKLDIVVGGVGEPAFTLLRWLCRTSILNRSSMPSFFWISVVGSKDGVGVLGKSTPDDESKPSSSLLLAILSSRSFFLASRERF